MRWLSTVPGNCELGRRVSFYPGATVSAIRAKIEAAVASVAATDPWLIEHPPVISFGSEGSTIALDHPLSRGVTLQHESITGSPIVNTTSTAINDSRYFNPLANEWPDVSSLAPTMKVLAASVLDWCGIG